MRTLAFLGCLALFAIAGCGDDNGGHDMSVSHDLAVKDMPAAHDLAFQSACGHPSDVGNSKGVGKFCMKNSDCGSPSLLCSNAFHPGTFFCTVASTCNPPVDTATCGENTVCQCDPNLGCGCTPADCAMPQG